MELANKFKAFNAQIKALAVKAAGGSEKPGVIEVILGYVIFGCSICLAYGLLTATTIFGFVFLKAIFITIAKIGIGAIVLGILIAAWKYYTAYAKRLDYKPRKDEKIIDIN